MSDLLILPSTFGGIFVLGAVGVTVGPIVAALFVSIWHIYGETFSDWLPVVPGDPGGPGEERCGGGPLPPPGDEVDHRRKESGAEDGPQGGERGVADSP